jgi:hypothetical protein
LEVTSSLIAGRVVVEIHFPEESLEPATSQSNFEVCSVIAQNHGGELRVRSHDGGTVFEVELPLAPGTEQRTPSAPAALGRVLTLMLVDPDFAAQHQLLGLLSARGHRVVPVRAEEAADLAHRLRFDGVVWALRSGGLKWSDYQDRLRESIPAFVLVSDGYDADLAAGIEEKGGFLLARPLREPELERVLGAVEARSVVRA